MGSVGARSSLGVLCVALGFAFLVALFESGLAASPFVSLLPSSHTRARARARVGVLHVCFCTCIPLTMPASPCAMAPACFPLLQTLVERLVLCAKPRTPPRPEV